MQFNLSIFQVWMNMGENKSTKTFLYFQNLFCNSLHKNSIYPSF